MDSERDYYPIGTVAELTGVNPVTLRAWQRRYGLVQPQRTKKGHRLYSDDDVQRIQAILGWLEKGVSIGQVKSLLDDEAAALDPSVQRDEAQVLIAALQNLDPVSLRKQLQVLCLNYPTSLVLEHIVNPIQSWLMQSCEPRQPLLLAIWSAALTEHSARRLAAFDSEKTPHWLVNLDKNSSGVAWLEAVLMSEQGSKPTVLSLDELPAALPLLEQSLLLVFGERSLVAEQLKNLANMVMESGCELKLRGSIRDIHQQWYEELRGHAYG